METHNHAPVRQFVPVCCQSMPRHLYVPRVTHIATPAAYLSPGLAVLGQHCCTICSTYIRAQPSRLLCRCHARMRRILLQAVLLPLWVSRSPPVGRDQKWLHNPSSLKVLKWGGENRRHALGKPLHRALALLTTQLSVFNSATHVFVAHNLHFDANTSKHLGNGLLHCGPPFPNTTAPDHHGAC